MTANQPTPTYPAGTPVLNTNDGEPGSILSAVAFDAALGAWTEYEVETANAIETWKTADFIVRSGDAHPDR